MSPRDNIEKQVRRKAPIVPPSRALPSVPREGKGHSIPELDASEATPQVRRATDRWSFAFMVLGLCVFAAAFFIYVLDPAMTTLLDTSWSGEGP